MTMWKLGRAANKEFLFRPAKIEFQTLHPMEIPHAHLVLSHSTQMRAPILISPLPLYNTKQRVLSLIWLTDYPWPHLNTLPDQLPPQTEAVQRRYI